MIPAFNHERYVTEALDSIVADPYADKEIVIVNDGSQDATDEKIREWIRKNQDSIEIHYRNQSNQGLTKTLNTLLSMASGDYLVALASDDYLLPGGIEARVRYLKEHTKKYAVFADCIVVDENSQTISESGLFSYRHANKRRLMSDAGIRREFLTNFAMPGPVLMVRRDFYRKFGGYNDEMYMEDYDLYLRFAAYDMIGFLDKKVSAYRIHGENMSDTDSPRYLRLLEDSRITLLQQRHNFHGLDKVLLYWQVMKFTFRIEKAKARVAKNG
jgi:glycosyltransferase involved in cell wall biosynthesis